MERSSIGVMPTTLLRTGAAALVFYVFAVAAEGRLPSIDVQASCAASAKAVFEATGDKTVATAENCLKQENEARNQLMKRWDTFSSADRAQCIDPKAYMPSYVEWLTCFQMRQEVKEEQPKK
jgi:hypothetical protein